jgi:ATP-dependent protease HslVU (ClpYQ) peptidase subunit
MTCTIGVLSNDGTIWIGSDSAATADVLVEIRNDKKVFYNANNNDFLIGIAGSFKLGNVLQYIFEPPKVPKGMDINTYMNKLFIVELKECFNDYTENFGVIKDGLFFGDWIVGYKTERNSYLYHIYNDLHVGVLKKNYIAIGSGAMVALGSLYSTEHIENVQQRIEIALNASGEFINTVYPPYYILKL